MLITGHHVPGVADNGLGSSRTKEPPATVIQAVSDECEDGRLEALGAGAEEPHMAYALDQPTTHIVSSPYTDLVNQLEVGTLSISVRLFALALSTLAPIRTDYATSPYMSSFNWEQVFSRLRMLCASAGLQWEREEFYVVIFRSRRRQGINVDRLGGLDKRSHEEACASGGLLKYWFGSCDDEMRNLATCIWRNREDAAAGGQGPWHKKARAAAREMYESISFHTHKLVIEGGAEKWQLEEYVD